MARLILAAAILLNLSPPVFAAGRPGYSATSRRVGNMTMWRDSDGRRCITRHSMLTPTTFTECK